MDLHSRLRLRPIVEYINRLSEQSYWSLNIFDYGCGKVNLYDLISNLSISYSGIDVDEDSIRAANFKLAYSGRPQTVYHKEELDYNFSFAVADVIVLADVLEHMSYDEAADLMARILIFAKAGTSVLVSSPTKRYRKVFGERYDAIVGHVREVDLIEFDLTYSRRPSQPWLRRSDVKYTTGLIASIACFFYYRIPQTGTWIDKWKHAILSPFARLDYLNGPTRSCSWFAAFRVVK